MADESLIYLDNHATTQCDPRVVEAMLPWFSRDFANPASVTHEAGRQSADEVARCRASVADLIGANRPDEIVFTSGATESNALAILGASSRHRGGHFISLETEHPSVLQPMARLEGMGFEVDRLPVRSQADPVPGLIDLDRLRSAVRPTTILVSIMLANNEIGVIQPLSEIAAICHERDVMLHCDATQATGKIPVDVDQLGIDLMSFTGHKFFGPKGCGGLYLRGTGGRRARIDSWMTGGGQERNLRGGTLNVPGIVGLTKALALAVQEMDQDSVRILALRDRLWKGLQAGIPGLLLNGPPLDAPELRLPNNLNCRFPAVVGHSLMLKAQRLALSSGSACTATASEPSHVLRAIGLSDDEVRCSLRFGLGRFNTEAEIDMASSQLSAAWQELRSLQSV